MEDFSKYFNRGDINLYKIMGRETTKIAHSNKWIDERTVRELKRILKD